MGMFVSISHWFERGYDGLFTIVCAVNKRHCYVSHVKQSPRISRARRRRNRKQQQQHVFLPPPSDVSQWRQKRFPLTNLIWLNTRSFHVRSSLEHNRSSEDVNVPKVCPAVRRPKTTTTIVSLEKLTQTNSLINTDYEYLRRDKRKADDATVVSTRRQKGRFVSNEGSRTNLLLFMPSTTLATQETNIFLYY